ncbi:hypothetical protein CHELA1G11_12839 [Hyphomicrobiales bacterium]|nr:hypothetical protein CHELA1G2_11470 [Hyphomicrobiales bacterium]CAH1667482.1 hypothetical protein CHELA1G11_12839 [Hyphomicrobiales bacterium]
MHPISRALATLSSQSRPNQDLTVMRLTDEELKDGLLPVLWTVG